MIYGATGVGNPNSKALDYGLMITIDGSSVLFRPITMQRIHRDWLK